MAIPLFDDDEVVAHVVEHNRKYKTLRNMNV